MKPEFVVIAGPNGSGKSFFSTDISSTLAKNYNLRSFDFDFRFSEIYIDFLSIMTPQLEINIYNRVKEIFEEEADVLYMLQRVFRIKPILINYLLRSGGWSFLNMVLEPHWFFCFWTA